MLCGALLELQVIVLWFLFVQLMSMPNRHMCVSSSSYSIDSDSSWCTLVLPAVYCVSYSGYRATVVQSSAWFALLTVSVTAHIITPDHIRCH